MDGILSAIAKAEATSSKDELTGDWLKNVVDAHLHPERYMTEEQRDRNKTFYELAEEYPQIFSMLLHNYPANVKTGF